MKTVWFLTKQVLHELGVKRAIQTAGLIIVTTLFLVSFYLLFVARSQPPVTHSQSAVMAKKGQILAELNSGLPADEVNSLYLKLRNWDSIRDIQFIFGAEFQAEQVDLPGDMNAESDFFLVEASSKKAKLTEELGKQSQITAALVLQRNLTSSTPTSFVFPSWIKIISLIGVVAFALGILGLAYQAINNLARSWKGEFQILKYSGIEGYKVRIPFVGYGFMCGFIGSLLGILLLYGTTSWAKASASVGESLPALMKSSFVMGLALWSLLLGPLMGLLGAVVGAQQLSDEWSEDVKLEEP